jgi:hypothetical protein
MRGGKPVTPAAPSPVRGINVTVLGVVGVALGVEVGNGKTRVISGSGSRVVVGVLVGV